MVSEGDKTYSSDNETVESESGQYPDARGRSWCIGWVG